MLTPCPSCRRYIRDTETACPFCKKRGSRIALGAVAVMAATALTACQSNKPEPADANDAALPATATVPEIEPTPVEPTTPEANNPPAPAETATPEPTPPPAESVADNNPPPPPATSNPPVSKPQLPQRPMVMRYGISPRLPPTTAPAPAPKK
jgi:endogenous inhibitor of DNA gyrase (YacG/DUF329 family)